MDSPAICSACKRNVSAADIFCPVCGTNLKKKPLATSPTKQVLIYLLSFFLPPLGVWPAIKYLRQPDEKSKRIGLAAILLTVISIVITIWLTAGFVGSFQKQLKMEFDPFQDQGF